MSKKQPRMPDYPPLDVQRAALLVSMGHSHKEVAAAMDMTSQRVERLLQVARDQGILLPPVHPIDWSKIDDRVWDQLVDPDLASDIQDRLKRHGVAHVRLVRHHIDGEQTKLRVMRLAASILASILARAVPKARKPPAVHPPLGFTSGQLLRAAVNHADLPVRIEGMRLVALGGDPPLLPDDADYAAALECSANGIVGKLAGRLRLPPGEGWRFPIPALWSPPAVPNVPTDLLRTLVRELPNVQAIVGNGKEGGGPREPLIDQMGAIFAELEAPVEAKGDAPADAPADPAWVAGRINGHLLARRGADAAARAECERQNGFALGASPAELARVAERARSRYSGRGIILVASGEAALDGVMALVHARAVNELVIDSELARAILHPAKRSVHGEPPEPPVSLRATG